MEQKTREAAGKKMLCNGNQMGAPSTMVPAAFLTDLCSALKSMDSAIHSMITFCDNANGKSKTAPISSGKGVGSVTVNKTVPSATPSTVKPVQSQPANVQQNVSGEYALASTIQSMHQTDTAVKKILHEKIASFINDKKAKTAKLTENESKRSRSFLTYHKLVIGNPSHPKRPNVFSREELSAWVPVICALRDFPEFFRWPGYPSLDYFGGNYGFLKTAAALVLEFKKQAPEKTVLNEITLSKNAKKLAILCEMVYSIYVMSSVFESNKNVASKTEEKTDEKADEKTDVNPVKKRKHDDDDESYSDRDPKHETGDDNSVEDKEDPESDHSKHEKKRRTSSDNESSDVTSNSDNENNSDVVIEDEYE
jgi:hypothetical protein